MRLRYPCFRAGHDPDPLYPMRVLVLKDEERVEWWRYITARCKVCGGLFVVRKRTEEPSGLVDADGEQLG